MAHIEPQLPANYNYILLRPSRRKAERKLTADGNGTRQNQIMGTELIKEEGLNRETGEIRERKYRKWRR